MGTDPADEGDVGAGRLEEQVDALARQLLDRRQGLIDALFEITRREVQALDHDARLRALLEASITENIVSAINFVSGGTTVDELEAPTAAHTYARTLAQRDVPLSALIRAYRIGHSRFLDLALGLIGELPAPEQMHLVLHLVRRSAEYIDKVCDQVGRSYEIERDRWVSSRGGLRQQAINEVLTGTATDIRQAERTLSYSFDGTHVAVEAWPGTDVAGFDVARLFDDTARTLARALRAVGPPLLVPNDEREARAWFALRSADAVLSHDLAAAVAAAGLSVHLAVGDPAPGIEGFRTTIRQAERVKEIMTAGAAGIPSVVTHREVATVALMSDDTARLRSFVSSTLTGLAVDDERCATLRETLRTFIDRNRSYSATAEAMTLHRNSIQYRVQQALDACGRDLDLPGTSLELQAALEAARWLGPAVLHPRPI